MSCSSKLTEPRMGSLEFAVFHIVVRSTGENLGLQLSHEVTVGGGDSLEGLRP